MTLPEDTRPADPTTVALPTTGTRDEGRRDHASLRTAAPTAEPV